jgi:hypothetical protein
VAELTLLGVGAGDAFRALHRHVATAIADFAEEVIVGVANLEELVGLAARAFIDENSGLGDEIAGVLTG